MGIENDKVVIIFAGTTNSMPSSSQEEVDKAEWPPIPIARRELVIPFRRVSQGSKITCDDVAAIRIKLAAELYAYRRAFKVLLAGRSAPLTPAEAKQKLSNLANKCASAETKAIHPWDWEYLRGNAKKYCKDYVDQYRSLLKIIQKGDLKPPPPLQFSEGWTTHARRTLEKIRVLEQVLGEKPMEAPTLPDGLRWNHYPFFEIKFGPKKPGPVSGTEIRNQAFLPVPFLQLPNSCKISPEPPPKSATPVSK